MKASLCRKRRLFLVAHKIVSVITLIFFSAGTVFALPAGQQVVNGQASFITQSNSLTITTSPNAIINWQGFSINNNEAVRFIQQYSASSVLNRVIGQDPSRILGLLQSNGRVFLINPNGILFGQGARIDVNGLFASTLAISNQDFLAGKFNFTAGSVAGSIQNQGTITTPAGGKVFLIAPDIENSGIINTPQGEVLLAAGHSVQLADSLDPNISVVVSAPGNRAVNLGQIVARSGKVGIYGGLISQRGIVNADSAVSEGGRIFLKAAKAIELDDTSKISADGVKGGQIIVKTEADGKLSGTLTARGTISAQGNGTRGSGGFVETSAKIADINGISVNTRGGTWLLDPDDVEINGTGTIGGATLITPVTIQNALVNNDFVVQTNAAGTGGNGDIFVNGAVAWNNANRLTLNAHRDINVNASITNTYTMGGNMILRSDSDANGTGTVAFGGGLIGGGGGSVNMGAGTSTVAIYYNPTDYLAATRTADVATFNSRVTAATRTYYMLVNDVGPEAPLATDKGLQAMKNNLAGVYALGKDIDASATSAWNGGLGFAPVGGVTAAFNGAFDGNNHTITTLTIIRDVNNIGLFGSTNAATIKNIGLVNGNIRGLSNVGGLVGSNNYGTISNSYTEGTVSGTTNVGGLVGYGYGGISNSYSTGTVSGTTSVGGLVGWNGGTGGGTIYNSYSKGAVSGTTNVGGLVGLNSNGPAAITSSYWDTITSGQSTSAGGTGMTTTAMKTMSNFSGWSIADAGGSSAVWRIYGGNTYPLLKSFLTPATVTANNATSKTYDGNAYSGGNGVTCSPGICSANNKYLGTVGYGGTSQGAKNAGSYTITPSGYYSDQQGNDISFANGALIVNRYAVSMTGSRAYDGTVNVAAGIFTLGPLVGSETLTLTGVGTVANKNVGTAQAVTLGTLTLGNALGNGTGLASNYTFIGGTQTADIAKAAIANVTGITANNKTYDGTPDATLVTTGAAFTDMIAGDTLNVSAATGLFSDKNAAAGKTVNISGIALGGLDAGNYNLTGTTASTTADIAKAAIANVTGITANNKTYDGTPNATLVTTGAAFTDMIAGDTLNVSAATGLFSDKNAAAGKTVNISGIALGGLDAGNYNLTGTTASTTADIAKAAIANVTGITANNKTYDGTPNATLVTTGAAFTDMIAGDTLNVSAATGLFSDKNAAAGKTVNISGIALGGLDAGNYNLTGTTASTTADIAKAAIANVTGITANNKTYDGTPNATLVTTGAGFTDMIAGDTLNVSAATGLFSDKNAAAGKTVNISGIALGGLDAGNYNLTGTTASTTADIAKAAIANVTGITANNKTYDGTPNATLVTTGAGFTDMIAGDTLNVSAATGLFSDKNAAAGKTVNISGIAMGGLDAGNYTLTSSTASTTADIAKAAIANVTGITANNKTYDGTPDATLVTTGAAFTDMIAGDTLNVSAATGLFSDKNAAAGKTVNISGIALGGLDAGNYNLTGTTASTTADIAKAAIANVTGITANNKTYDGTPNATLVTTGAAFTDMIAGDTLNVSAATGLFSDKNAAAGKTVNISGIALGGLDAGNYNLTGTTASTTADIAKAAIANVTGITANNKTYDGTPNATLVTTGAAFTDMIAGDTLNVSAATGLFSDKNAAAGKTVNISGIAMGGLDAGNYTLTSSTASTTADIAKAAIANVTGITANNKTYDGTPNATLVTTDAAFTAMIAGDTLNVSAATGLFSDKNAAAGKTVNISGIAMGGLDAGNYTLTSSTARTTADITARAVTITAATNTKGYDSNASAAATPTITAGSLAGGDTAALTELYDSKIAGTGKMLTPAAVITDGNGGNNYLITYVNNTTGVIEPGQTVSGRLDVAAAGKTIEFAVNGMLLADSAATDAGGNYSGMFPLNSIPNNSALLAYVANDGSVKSASVYLAPGGNITNLFLGSNTVTAGSGGGTMSNATLGIAKGILSSGDIPYSVSGTNLTLIPNVNFQTASGTTYAINGNITTANGAHTYNGPVTLLGNAVISSGTGKITFGGPVTGTGYHFTLNSQGMVTQTAPISVSGLELLGTGATYNLTNTGNAATTLAGNTGTVNFTNSTGLGIGTVNTAGLATSGDLTLSSDGAITQTAPLQVVGAATFGAGAGNDITLTHAGNSFSSVGITSGKDVSLRNAGALALKASTASNNLSATAGGNITLNGLVIAGAGAGTEAGTGAGRGNVTLNSGGAIINGMGSSTSITAGYLSAEAVNGIGSGDPLMTGVSKVTALNTTTNNIEIDNTGILTVSGLRNLGTGNVILQNIGEISTDTALVTSSGGTVSITAHSPLTIGSGGVSAYGSILLEAAPSGGSDDLTINGNIASLNGNISLKAGSSIVLGPGSSLSAPHGTIRLTYGNGIFTGAGNVTVTGNATATDNTVSSLMTAMGSITSAEKGDDEDERKKKTREGGQQTTDDKKTDDNIKKYCN